MALYSASVVQLFAICFIMKHDTVAGQISPNDDADNYISLKNQLLKNYDRRLRPDIGGPAVEATVSLNLLQIVGINANNNTLIAEHQRVYEWVDNRLVWDDNDANAVGNITLSPESVWNIATYEQLLEGMHIKVPVNVTPTDIHSGMVIMENGKIILLTEPTFTKTPCTKKNSTTNGVYICSITYANNRYPRDSLKLWLPDKKDAVNFEYYSTNDIWDVMTTNATTKLSSSSPFRISKVRFSLTLQEVVESRASCTVMPQYWSVLLMVAIGYIILA
ncbi:acetylcholine receptor subunit beta-type lev-1-like [Saccoglossus kowalevskii]|uniref:Acetylcholine receptor subunit beta-type lev-1-like n=1 Tax=Saccoglossus kowalevskii TaxID=10224 RepID=A0ABM0GRJ4_SACKO|nr:PREDICTED: acetylcholine receptor subunit beta-type lev-1-like [Saccoglossus kowalevskii]